MLHHSDPIVAIATAPGRGAVGIVRISGRQLAPLVQRECLKRGLILELGGRHASVVRFLPPLVITAAEVDRVAEIFGRALAAAVAGV